MFHLCCAWPLSVRLFCFCWFEKWTKSCCTWQSKWFCRWLKCPSWKFISFTLLATTKQLTMHQISLPDATTTHHQSRLWLLDVLFMATSFIMWCNEFVNRPLVFLNHNYSTWEHVKMALEPTAIEIHMIFLLWFRTAEQHTTHIYIYISTWWMDAFESQVNLWVHVFCNFRFLLLLLLLRRRLQTGKKF